jgi:hypothetical protein
MKNALILTILVAVIFSACKSSGEKITAENHASHYVEIRQRGVGMIGLDKVPNETVMELPKDTGNVNFFSYSVSFQDSTLVTDAQKKLEMGKYYQYDMQNDWVAMVNGDSVRPVFYQPKVKKSVQLNEGIIVFEIPSGIEPDTLIFADSYGYWGKHQVFLNN